MAIAQIVILDGQIQTESKSHCGALVVIGQCQLCEYLILSLFYISMSFGVGFFLRMSPWLCVFLCTKSGKTKVGVGLNK